MDQVGCARFERDRKADRFCCVYGTLRIVDDARRRDRDSKAVHQRACVLGVEPCAFGGAGQLLVNDCMRALDVEVRK